MKPNQRHWRNVILSLCVGSNRGVDKAFMTKSEPISGKDSCGCHWRSYSPLLTRLRTVKPAFFASVTESGFSLIGELKVERILRTGFLHAGQFVSGLADSGRRRVNFPPHTTQLPSVNSYS